MELVDSTAAARERIAAARKQGLTVGLVPTMGALHEGHLSLMRHARADCGFTVATIFVNPTQFGPNEDLARYPRDLGTDARLAEETGLDLLLAPPVEEVYRPGASTWVTVESLSDRLEGASRPGHFRGVATVVAKLFNMVQPDRAYFGQKDFQQLKVIQQMTRDLDFPIQIVPCETVREPDGLAMSSRNRYLSPEERKSARALSRALQAARDLLASGETSVTELDTAAYAVLDLEPGVHVDYVRIEDAETLEPIERVERPAVLLLAARVGHTRLIDNTILTPQAPAL